MAARRSTGQRGRRIATLRALEVPAGGDVLNLLPEVERMLSGGSDAVLPVPAPDVRETGLLTTGLRVGEAIDDDVALVVSTSGTTGVPKGAMLTAAALRASASATHARLGGPGQWLLALPAH
ncbi:MAG: AMP-binding protein, partial [Ilumatobacteraceae bacterium]